MKLNTGKVAFSVEFDNGDKQKIYFNPNDPDLAIRMRNFQKDVLEKVSEMEDIELKPDGTPVEESAFLAFNQFRKIVCDELDSVFSSKISDVVFKHCSPFALVDGEYFILQFMNAAFSEVEKHIEKANAEIQKKIEKHIGKYTKK